MPIYEGQPPVGTPPRLKLWNMMVLSRIAPCHYCGGRRVRCAHCKGYRIDFTELARQIIAIDQGV